MYDELERLWPEASELKILVLETSRPHCSSGLVALNFHLSEHLLNDLESFVHISFTSKAPFEHLYVPTNNLTRVVVDDFCREFKRLCRKTLHRVVCRDLGVR